jgi:hypothetical protein
MAFEKRTYRVVKEMHQFPSPYKVVSEGVMEPYISVATHYGIAYREDKTWLQALFGMKGKVVYRGEFLFNADSRKACWLHEVTSPIFSMYDDVIYNHWCKTNSVSPKYLALLESA